MTFVAVSGTVAVSLLWEAVRSVAEGGEWGGGEFLDIQETPWSRFSRAKGGQALPSISHIPEARTPMECPASTLA